MVTVFPMVEFKITSKQGSGLCYYDNQQLQHKSFISHLSSNERMTAETSKGNFTDYHKFS